MLDPAYAPATGTAGELADSSRELLAVVRGLQGMRIVPADIVEVAPAYRSCEIAAIATPHVGYGLHQQQTLRPRWHEQEVGGPVVACSQSARAGKTPGHNVPGGIRRTRLLAVGSPPWQALCDDCFRQELSSVTGTWSPQFPLPGVIGGCAAEDPGVQTRRRLCREPAFICLWSPPEVHRPHRLGETPSATQM